MLVLVLVLVLVQDVAVLALDLLPSPAAEDRTQTLQTLQTLQIELTLTVLSWYNLLTMNSRTGASSRYMYVSRRTYMYA